METFSLTSCNLCPRNCGVNRISGNVGVCQSGPLPRISRAEAHFWEEPCLSGKRGSGAVFFAGCSLRCAFCQNACISRDGSFGEEMDAKKLADVYLSLQKKEVHNINLVTPDHHLLAIRESLVLAKEAGLTIPVVYNCSGYETPDAIHALADLVDIWLPDCKFFAEKEASAIAAAPNYPAINQAAIQKMLSLQPKCIFDAEGMLQKGVIVRHLPLPGRLFDSKKIIDFVHSLGDGVWFSLLNQYTPTESCTLPDLKRLLPKGHYDSLVDYCRKLGMEQVYLQEADSADTAFIPEFYRILP